MPLVTLALNAMATRFEFLLHGSDPVSLRSAGEEALAEIERLEAQLSLFRPTSEIAHINAKAAREPVTVTPEVFELLEWAARLSRETDGAFDISIGPLVRCWGFHHGAMRVPNPLELDHARCCTGTNLVQLNNENRTIRFAKPGVFLDLGAIGKGYAIECAVHLLREAGVTSALIHGGTSTVYALGHPPDQDAWKVAIDGPPGISSHSSPSLATVTLLNEALSVSAIWGRNFEENGQQFGHVLDPRDGRPAQRAVLAAIVLPSATEADAFSTALLTLGPEALNHITNLRPHMRALTARASGSEIKTESRGIDSAWGQKPV